MIMIMFMMIIIIIINIIIIIVTIIIIIKVSYFFSESFYILQVNSNSSGLVHMEGSTTTTQAKGFMVF